MMTNFIYFIPCIRKVTFLSDMSEVAVSYGDSKDSLNESLFPPEKREDITYNGNYGEKFEYDPEYHGYTDIRKVTDIFMLVVFIIFLCGMLGVFFFALSKSWVSYLYLPTDYKGLVCGYDNNNLGLDIKNQNPNTSIDYTKKKYLFWYRPGAKGWTRSACVEKCPSEGNFITSYSRASLGFSYSKDESVYTDSEGRDVKAHIEDPYLLGSNRYVLPYPSTDLLQRCFPTEPYNALVNNSEEVRENLTEFTNSMGLIGTAMTDIQKTYWVIIIMAFAALILTILWIIVLKWSSGFFVGLTIVGAFVALIFITYECWAQREAPTLDLAAYTFGVFDSESNKEAFTILFYIMIVIDAIIFFIFIFMIKRIKIAVAVIKVVSRVFGDVPTLFFFPIVPFILYILWFAYCIGVAVVLFGAGSFSYDEHQTEGSSIGKLEFNYDTTIQYMSIYHFIGMLWGIGFISALCEMTVGGVFSRHFFTKQPKDLNLDSSLIWKSFKVAIRYHAGSIAFGSLIVTICTVLRIALEYFDKKTKNVQNSCVRCLVKCMKCCMYCFQKFIKYINRNAYVLIASHGYSFFDSAVRTFNLIARNPIRAAAVDSIGDFMLFLGKVLISCLIGAISMIWFQNMDDVTFYIIPTVFVVVVCFFISSSFTSLFEMGIDSSFICCLEDEERNDGSPGHERYADSELLAVMSN